MNDLLLFDRKGHIEVVECLSMAGADKEARSLKDLWTPLHEACRQGHVAIVKCLLLAGTDRVKTQNIPSAVSAASLPHVPISVTGSSGPTAIPLDPNSTGEGSVGPGTHRQSARGRQSSFRLPRPSMELLDRQNGPMHVASHQGHLAVVKCLLAAGSDKQALNSTKTTPLHYACMGGHVPVIECLLEAGADMELRDSAGCTPLYLAVKGGHLDAVRALLAVGADANALDNSGVSPMMLAMTCGPNAEEMAGLLIEAGAGYGDLKGQPGYMSILESVAREVFDCNSQQSNSRFSNLQHLVVGAATARSGGAVAARRRVLRARRRLGIQAIQTEGACSH